MAEDLTRPRASNPPAGETTALSDEALVHALQQAGFVTFDQMEAARLEQAAQGRLGNALSLGDVLILQGVITPAILENVTKKVQALAAGGIRTLGQYRLLKKLGEGGMGLVFLAEDTLVGRTVAVKVLSRKLADNRQFLTRFRREAIATGKLNHVNIVGAYTVGEEQGVHYFAMEYCDGAPLDAILKKAPFLPWDLATDVVTQAARGLQHAHEHGIIHRDIKPANLFICRPPRASGVSIAPDAGSPLDLFAEGFVLKILDLGLSKDTGQESSSFLTQDGVAMGTPHYISPEQAMGKKDTDGRTDIYSLGATFYHLVTGKTPFSGSTGAEIMMKHLNEQLLNPQDVNDEVPDGVVQIIQKMMAKAPADRYANCKEVLEDLKLVLDGKMPSSHAIDVSKSSVGVACRKPSPLAEKDRRERSERGERGRSGGLAASASASRQASVGTGRGVRHAAEDDSEGVSRSRKRLNLVLGGVGLAVLLLLGVLLGISGNADATRGAGAEKKADPAEQRSKEDEARWKQESARLEEERRKLADEREKAEEARLKDAAAKRESEEQRLEAEKRRLAEEAEAKKKAEEARLKDAAAKRESERQKLEAEKRRLAAAAEAKKNAEATGQTQTAAERTDASDERYAANDKVLGQATELTVVLGGGVRMEFVLVKAGEFQMGGPRNRKQDSTGEGNEGPIHKVTITKPFYIGKYPVTVAQFAAFVDATKYVTNCEKSRGSGAAMKDGRYGATTGVSWRKPSFEQTPEHPVVLVSWNDTQEFCKWASKVAHDSGWRGEIRLPTEAQWEWAARGPQSLAYPFGEEWDGQKVNHRDAALQKTGFQQAPCSNDNDGYAYTSPVGKFANASWCGAFDMVGNVEQWVQDWEADYTAEAQVDPQGPAKGSRRVARGGSWLCESLFCRTAFRSVSTPSSRGACAGFRVVLVPGLP